MEELLKKKNVVAVVRGHKKVGGVDTGRDAIVVYVTKKVPLSVLSKEDVIPKIIQDLESDVQETEDIRALASDRTKKWRPAPGGVSIGHPKVTAGTLGMIVWRDGIAYILSNNHVLANSNDAYVGDEAWQPGKVDGGKPADTIGHLSSFIKINFEDEESTCPLTRACAAIFNFWAKLFHRKSRLSPTVSTTNKVDCAIAKPLLDEDISQEILEIGKPAGFNFEIKVDDIVRKSGRTSELTRGTVVGTDGIAKVNYGDRIAVFKDQIFTTAIAQGGDSGSVVLNERTEVVGLLFAGSSTLTIVNKIANVIDALGLDKGV